MQKWTKFNIRDYVVAGRKHRGDIGVGKNQLNKTCGTQVTKEKVSKWDYSKVSFFTVKERISSMKKH